jgi:hypothetical protein
VFEDVIKTLLETERIHSPVPEELSIPSSLRDMNDRERSSSSSRNLSEEEPHLLSRWKTKVALLSPHQLKRNDMNQVDLILHLSRVVIENIVTNEEMEIDTIVLTKRWRLTLSFSRRDGDWHYRSHEEMEIDIIVLTKRWRSTLSFSSKSPWATKTEVKIDTMSEKKTIIDILPVDIDVEKVTWSLIAMRTSGSVIDLIVIATVITVESLTARDTR